MLHSYAMYESRYLTRRAIVATLRATGGLAPASHLALADPRDLDPSSAGDRIKPPPVTRGEWSYGGAR